MKRREFLKGGSLSLAWAGAMGLDLPPLKRYSGTAFAEEGHTALPIPPLLENRDRSGQSARFELTVRNGVAEFFLGRSTATLGYNGNFLGPTIRVRNGQRFRLNLTNDLQETTTLHWHGLHVPAKWDGGPRQPIPPGATWSPEFTIKQQAATLWYHPHALGLTGEQVYRGLAGFFLIDDEYSDMLDLPKTYGVDDIPLVFQDRRFDFSGQFAYRLSMHDIINGVVGNYLLVNGVLKPTLSVPKGLVRFRILNGSNSSIYRLGLSDNRQFHIIASDGGFFSRPQAVTSMILSAGERAEILVDFSQAENRRSTAFLVEQYRGIRFEAMTVKTDDAVRNPQSVPAALRPSDPIPESKATRTRRFIMETMGGGRGMMGGGRGMMGGGMGMMGGRLTINGKRMDIRRIDERVKAGSIEVWEIENRSGMMMNMPHSMHLHDVQFRVLSRNGNPPLPHELGRKDTVLAMPGETVRIIIKFGEYKGIYMYHCHFLEHEDDGMMGQFEVV